MVVFTGSGEVLGIRLGNQGQGRVYDGPRPIKCLCQNWDVMPKNQNKDRTPKIDLDAVVDQLTIMVLACLGIGVLYVVLTVAGYRVR